MNIGDILPNGRHVVAFIQIGNGDGLVLAANDATEPTEWVTWKFYRNDPASTSHGHYLRSLTEGYESLQNRFNDFVFYE